MSIGENNITVDRPDLSAIDASAFVSAVGAEDNSALSYTEVVDNLIMPDEYNEIDVSAENFAGISENFVTNLHAAIDDYIKDISAKLEELETNVKVDAAFKGTEVESSLKTLIINVDNEASAYALALKNAERSVVEAVHNAYTKHDASIGSDISTDASALKAEDSNLDAASGAHGAGGGGTATISKVSMY